MGRHPSRKKTATADELQRLFEEGIGRNFSDQDREKLLESMPGMIEGSVSDIADIVYPCLMRTAPSMLRAQRATRRGFEKRLYRLWKKGIDLLEAYLVVATEIGASFDDSHREDAARTQDFLFEALVRLQARAVQVGHEVLCLLAAGFADGAHARWRTAHEIAVVAHFLARHGKETAERYLIHEVIESDNIMSQYQQHADALGCECCADAEVAEVKALRDSACARFGLEFGKDYGWASEALTKQCIPFRKNRGPTLSDIEKASGMEHLRPYYRMASHNVHANPKGITFRLGQPDSSVLLLYGSSDYGLDEPADGIAISVLQTTVPMLATRPTIDNLVRVEIMERYVYDIGAAFADVQLAMNEPCQND